MHVFKVRTTYLSLLIQTTGSQGSEICLHLTAILYISCHDRRPEVCVSSPIPYDVKVSEELLVVQQAPPLFWLSIVSFSLLLAFLLFLLLLLIDLNALDTFWAISIAAKPAIRYCKEKWKELSIHKQIRTLAKIRKERLWYMVKSCNKWYENIRNYIQVMKFKSNNEVWKVLMNYTRNQDQAS